MKRYTDPEKERFQYMVRQTLNGYSIEVLIVPTGDLAALTETVAAQIEVALPRGYRVQSGTERAAERQLEEVARLNGWVELKALVESLEFRV